MSSKQQVFELLDKLPDNATLDQISEEIAILAAIQRGLESSDAERVITHEDLKNRSATWIPK
jgi:predicted transcriptional regulator